MDEISLSTQLLKIGFTKLGSGWFENKEGDIRIRVWIKDEIDFWLWRSSNNPNENEIRFRGKVYTIEEIKWIIDRCFNS